MGCALAGDTPPHDPNFTAMLQDVWLKQVTEYEENRGRAPTPPPFDLACAPPLQAFKPRQIRPSWHHRVMSPANLPTEVVMLLAEETKDEVKAVCEVLAALARGDLGPKREIRLRLLPESPSLVDRIPLTADEASRVLVDSDYPTDDLWLQDWGEVVASRAPGTDSELLTTFDLGRGRGFEGFAEHLAARFRTPVLKLDFDAQYDYGGNVEATPDDILVIGNNTSDALREYLSAHGYDKRMAVLTTDWLKVGHVDELVSFLPLPDTPLGYAVLVSDPFLGWEILSKVPPRETFEGVFQAALRGQDYFPGLLDQDENPLKKVMNRIGDAVAEAQLGAKHGFREILPVSQGNFENNLQVLFEAIRAHRGPDVPIPVIRVPTVYHAEKDEDGGDTFEITSLQPESANMVVLPGVALVPDPLIPAFREATSAAIRAVGYEVFFISSLTFHDGHGQLHCGTQVVRDPNRWLAPRYQREALRPVRRPVD